MAALPLQEEDGSPSLRKRRNSISSRVSLKSADVIATEEGTLCQNYRLI